jgi:hypothetical protein
MYTRAYTCMHARAHARVRIHTHTHTHARTHAQTYAHAHMRTTYTHAHATHTRARAHTHTQTRLHTHSRSHTHAITRTIEPTQNFPFLHLPDFIAVGMLGFAKWASGPRGYQCGIPTQITAPPRDGIRAECRKGSLETKQPCCVQRSLLQ